MSTIITKGMIGFEQALQFDIYKADGSLFLKKGVVIYNHSHIDAITDGTHYTLIDFDENGVRISEEEELDTTQYIEDIISRLEIAYNNFLTNGYNLIKDIIVISAKLVDQLEETPDAMLGIIHMRTDLRYSIMRTLQNTIFTVLTARHMEWDKRRVIKLASASLTANLGMYMFQDELNNSDELADWQKGMIKKHTIQSVKMLIGMGLKDKDWLQTVGFHHEMGDGSGYPNGLENNRISDEAKLLSIADRYGARISSRGKRISDDPHKTMRLFLDSENSPYDQNMVEHFIAEIGVYPPGLTVKLQNGDIAIVIERGINRAVPKVLAVWREDGTIYTPPLIRDTFQEEFHILIYHYAEDLHKINANILWGENTNGQSIFRDGEHSISARTETSDDVRIVVTADDDDEEDVTLF
ncbi:MAG: HD domain-containing protein [Thiotrichales bacterium]|jgi:HD-GYP domain-containing protein (c-di-GMP phosphodiesterase class II)|nr:HD domain-containing protein [Thiotrichales bacterium]MBT3612698.1 HD domain-containing protein [Thiotrichales bacterium]MBT4260861.1 HD domain-containing protein [Thiotrichales bacterium]MBT5290519.1 HD domain-containing protein [Thiotrichales bacterium]MBT5417835.1 HD domain-containing protein [Thiotrichales bacterium]